MSRSLAASLVFLLVFGITGSEPWGSTAMGQGEPLARVIVKLREPLAREIQDTAPSSLVAQAAETLSAGPRAFLNRHRGRRLRALYPRLIRAMRQRGASPRALALASRRRFASRAGRQRGGFQPPDLSRTYVLEIPAATREALDRAIADLSRDPDVEYAEEDRLVSLFFVPDDPYLSTSGSWGQPYDDLYGVKKIGAPAAWDVTNGSGVVVAVVDTGLDVGHPDIAANVWTNAGEIPGNGVDDDGNGYVDDTHGWDFVGPSYTSPVEDNEPDDQYGHGTHVAGTIAATGNNGVGVVGVAFGARVMAVKGLSDAGVGLDSTLASAVIYAADNGADVINASFGGSGTSQTLQDAVDYAHSMGVVFVAAAGNSNSDASLFYPAGFANAIAVAATDPYDAKASFSNWGRKIDVAAPGVDALSLRAAGTTRLTPLGTDYARASGTSMAAPHVSGLAALILSAHPEFSNEQVRQAMRASALDTNGNGIDPFTGYGRIDAATAVTLDTPLEARILSPQDGSRIASETNVVGTAFGLRFAYYVLELGEGESPSSWTQVAVGSEPVSEGTLGVLDPSGWPDGTYTLRLRAVDSMGRDYIDQTRIAVDYVAIESPAPPVSSNTAEVFKPGELVTLEGRATGSGFVSYTVEWAPGLEPVDGWSDTGITLADGGTSPVNGGALATWDTTALSGDAADFYTLRLVVDEGSFTSESRTRVYLEPDLLGADWPRSLDVPPELYGGFVPATNADGGTRLTLAVPYYGTKRGRFATFSPDGSNATFLEIPEGSPFAQPLAADLDGLPGDEVAVNEGLDVHVYREDLTTFTLPRVPGSTVNFQYGAGVAADLDGDGTLETLAVGTDFTAERAYLYAWRRDGEQFSPAFPVALADVGRKTHYQVTMGGPRFLVVDLDGDGEKEIVAAEGLTASSFRLSLFDRNGEARVWQAFEIEGRISQMVAADLDRDGTYEIIVGYMVGLDEVVSVLDSDGSVRSGWPVTVLTGFTAAPYLAIGDLDRDGRDEVAVSAYSWLTVLRDNGALYSSDWPYQGGPYWFPILADVDGDGYPEILVTRHQSSTGPPLTDGASAASSLEPLADPGTVQNSEARLLAVGRDATVRRAWRLMGAGGAQSFGVWTSIAAGDFDENGTLDIAVTYPTVGGATGGYSVVNGAVAAVLSTGAPAAPEAQDWPMNAHDRRNSSVRPRPESVPPMVAIAAPLDGATVTGTVTLTAVASDEGRVLGVQFYADGSPVGPEDIEFPYAAEWSTFSLANGGHVLTATARDLAGNRGSSMPVNVTVDNDHAPPAAILTFPPAGAVVRGSLTVSADASDNVGVAGVQFLLDGANLGPEDLEAPYSAVWNTTSSNNGSHALRVVARDAAGNSVITSPASVVVDNQPPVASVTAPVEGAVVHGTTTVTASASDNLQIAGVQFQLDGVALGAEDVTAPYSIAWDTTSFMSGSHSLSAVARDTAGNTSMSAPVNVVVSHTVLDAVYDVTLKAPRCQSPASLCDSGSLLNGRAGLGPEPNQPNTIHNSCTDGTAGRFHVDESIDLVRVSSLDGTLLSAGKPARVDVTVWAYAGYTSDKLDLYYAANASTPSWVFIATLTPPGSGAQTLSATYTLPAGANQAIRARFRYGGSASPCGAGSYNDHDDLVFAADLPPDAAPPTVTITSPSEGAAVTGTVTISADARDDLWVDRVEFYVDGALAWTDASAPFEYAWNTTGLANGSHRLSAKAYDAAGNVGESAAINVNVSLTSGIAVYDPISSAPGCPAVGSFCDSGALLDGRGPLGPEPNAPNTIFGSCTDSTYGTYHQDESSDRIRIETLDGTPFAAGKTVRVDVTVWAYSAYTSDKLDLYYAADATSPSWTFVATLTPTKAGAQTLTASYVLPAGAMQAVRARFRYGGSAVACGPGSYNDHDDLIFAVTQ